MSAPEPRPTDLELLASVLGGRKSDEEAAAKALLALGGASGLAKADETELAPLVGGARRARMVLAALMLGERVVETKDELPERIASAADVGKWGALRLGTLEHEELWVLALDGRSRLRGTRCVARGGLHGMGTRASDVLRAAIRLGASGFVLVHNHPSGDPTPSAEDVVFTQHALRAALAVGVPLLDHVVVAGRRYASVLPLADDGSTAASSADGARG